MDTLNEMLAWLATSISARVCATSLLLWGCAGEEAKQVSGAAHEGLTVQLSETGGGDAMFSPLTLCDIQEHSTAYGVYMVTSLEGRYEDHGSRPYQLGVTYVQLEAVEPWTSDTLTQLRIIGGPEPNGVVRGHFVELAIGQTYALFPQTPFGKAEDPPTIRSPDVFSLADDVVTNGMITATLEDLKAAAIANQSGCVRDILPSARASEDDADTQTVGAEFDLEEP